MRQGSVDGGRGASLVEVRVWCKKVMSWLRPCVSVFNLRMRVCSSITVSALLEKFPFNITHSRSQIVWSGLLKCLATGSPLLLFRMLFCDCSYAI